METCFVKGLNLFNNPLIEFEYCKKYNKLRNFLRKFLCDNKKSVSFVILKNTLLSDFVV